MSEITIRMARPQDALGRLAALDSATPLKGDALIAELCGRAVAAIEIATGRTVADPFEKTAEIVELLRLRARPAPVEPGRSRTRFLPRAA